MLLLAGHVPHQIVHKLVHLLDVLGGVRLVLETHHVVRHLDHQAPLAVVILGGVSDLCQHISDLLFTSTISPSLGLVNIDAQLPFQIPPNFQQKAWLFSENSKYFGISWVL